MNQAQRKKLIGTPTLFEVKWLRDPELKG